MLPKSPPLLRRRGGAIIHTVNTADGPATVALARTQGGIRGGAIGPGAVVALESVPRLVGLDDDPSAFCPPPGLIAELHRRNRGLRLGSTGRVFDALVPTILGQRVTREEARQSYRRLIVRAGAPGPGEEGMLLPPTPEGILALGYDDFLTLGIEKSRARVLLEAARSARRAEEIIGMTRAEAEARLLAFPGVGPWTVANVMGVAWGDRDAVPTGDFHLPNTVAWALAGEARATDERMLELLEPYRPYRRRVVSLIKMSGVRAPRYGPRAPRSTISRHRG